MYMIASVTFWENKGIKYKFIKHYILTIYNEQILVFHHMYFHIEMCKSV